MRARKRTIDFRPPGEIRADGKPAGVTWLSDIVGQPPSVPKIKYPTPDPDGPLDPGYNEPDVIDADVERKVHELTVVERARRVMRAGNRSEAPPALLLSDALAMPRDPVRFRFDRLWPARGRVILAAQSKVGKSTLVGNVVRSLVDVVPFLGEFDTTPMTGRVVLIDTELDAEQIYDDLGAQGIEATDRVAVFPLRGRVGSFDLLDRGCLKEWAAELRRLDAEVVILDCLRPTLDALGLSEDKDAGQFLVNYDELLNEAQAAESLVVHHTGHTGERSRGSSRLRDWPDVEWWAVRADDATDPTRFFRAYGRRRVEVPETALVFDSDTNRLTWGAGSRAHHRAAQAGEGGKRVGRPATVDFRARVLAYVDKIGTVPSKSAFLGKVKGSKQSVFRAIDELVADGVLTTQPYRRSVSE